MTWHQHRGSSHAPLLINCRPNRKEEKDTLELYYFDYFTTQYEVGSISVSPSSSLETAQPMRDCYNSIDEQPQHMGFHFPPRDFLLTTVPQFSPFFL